MKQAFIIEFSCSRIPGILGSVPNIIDGTGRSFSTVGSVSNPWSTQLCLEFQSVCLKPIACPIS
nr:hypothetical protein [Aquimarina aggregata]